ncbi:hypothetical protein CMV_023359 [Castanea mollissima]|uniref:Band 7 domain-containing protein n=1 Tax=Castanea mollissima TaxID=60419 RepID=A0A8J4QGN8_9ROSI|nr:hypothetical protein CMV_023359 [Castanea mollissima]
MQTKKPPQGPGACGSGFSILIVFLSFFTIFTIIVIPSSITIRNGMSILRQVPEGHVGVYWRGGALQKTITYPGFHLKLLFINHYEPVQVTLQTDQVRDIPCGTKGGVMIDFEKIEVVNRLHKDYVYNTLLNYGVQYDNTWIYDKIHHEINQFCSSHSLQKFYIDVFDQSIPPPLVFFRSLTDIHCLLVFFESHTNPNLQKTKHPLMHVYIRSPPDK